MGKLGREMHFERCYYWPCYPWIFHRSPRGLVHVKNSYRFVKSNYTSVQPLTEPSDDGRHNFFSKFLRRPAEFWEGAALLVLSCIGFIGEQSIPYSKWELFNATEPTPTVCTPAEWQHCTMYAFFITYAIVLLLSRTCVSGLRSYETFFCALAFFSEALLFYFHSQQRNSLLDYTVHSMIVLAATMTAIISTAEIWMVNDTLLPFLRSATIMLQGTWFLQIASMLTGQWEGKCSPWTDSHANAMFATMAVGWHLAVSILFTFGILGIVSFICDKGKSSESPSPTIKDDAQHEPLLHTYKT
ncbi:transmembrane protein 45A-like [Saccoglossus kowalevskii]|uniref:Transmembrane protein 45B-like n=1 Tax=Saccoglossus kowalevskii TaxID=10224 RepID=A0ABM0M9L0_SACKO|nr:PREDICTED: transmembrane protein 45B-like [Saccoglossus kowalevskii]